MLWYDYKKFICTPLHLNRYRKTYGSSDFELDHVESKNVENSKRYQWRHIAILISNFDILIFSVKIFTQWYLCHLLLFYIIVDYGKHVLFSYHNFIYSLLIFITLYFSFTIFVIMLRNKLILLVRCDENVFVDSMQILS